MAMYEPLSDTSTETKPIKVQSPDGRLYVWKCEYHNVDLKGGGHSQGLGVECWEGMMFDYNTATWAPDSSELFCPALINDPSNEETEACVNSWELVEIKNRKEEKERL